MDIIAIEKESFDSFKKKLEQIVSLVPKQPSNNTLCIEQEWIEWQRTGCFSESAASPATTSSRNGTLSFSYHREEIITDIRSEISVGTKYNQF